VFPTANANTMNIPPILPERSIDDMETYLLSSNKEYNDKKTDETRILATVCYLGHLCCRKQFIKVIRFLDQQSAERRKLFLNTRLQEFWDGTLLHILLYWNHCPSTFDMYAALRDRGAIPCQDSYGQLPWEIGDAAATFIPPGGTEIYRGRKASAYLPLYQMVYRYENRTF
jgi:hypothetical protein